MTNPTAFNAEDTFDEAQEFWDAYDGADWYCNHDVPNGCYECARARNVQAMLDAMTPAERDEYFGSVDDYHEAF